MQTFEEACVRQSAECSARHPVTKEDQCVDRMSAAGSAWNVDVLVIKFYKKVAAPGRNSTVAMPPGHQAAALL